MQLATAKLLWRLVMYSHHRVRRWSRGVQVLLGEQRGLLLLHEWFFVELE